MQRILLWRALLITAILAVSWRIVNFNLSEFYQGRVEGGLQELSAERAVSFNDGNAEALATAGLALLETDEARAKDFLERSVRENPTRAFPVLGLAELARLSGDTDTGDKLAYAAVELMPVKPELLTFAGRYWAMRGDIENAIKYWALVLEIDGTRSEDLYPVFFHIAEDEQVRESLKILTDSPPSWWADFFSKFSSESEDMQSVRAVFNLRRQSEANPVTLEEREAYIWRVENDGFVGEAYVQWDNSLEPEQRQHVLRLYNGGFEEEITSRGFDWHISRRGKFVIEQSSVRGAAEEKALHIRFRGRKEEFHHVYQPLFLAPGFYEFSGRVRLDIDSIGGLQWKVLCKTETWSVMGATEKFRGSSDWKGFDVKFGIPDSCKRVRLRLDSSGNHPIEHLIRGEVWFDSLSIRAERSSLDVLSMETQ